MKKIMGSQREENKIFNYFTKNERFGISQL